MREIEKFFEKVIKKEKTHFTEGRFIGLISPVFMMRAAKTLPLVVALAGVVFLAGCEGPATKMGRGISNTGELLRWGELRYEMEQGAVWDGRSGVTKGFLKGFCRSLARTGVGVAEIVSSPFGPYDKGFIYPAYPRYPDNYTPSPMADSMWDPSTRIGFGPRGDIAPFVPGSRFTVFE